MNIEADEALQAIPPAEEYHEWFRQSVAYKAADGEFETWLAWCQRGSNPISEKEAIGKWSSFSTDGSIQANTLFWYAQQHGWRPKKEKQWHLPKQKKEPTAAEKTNVDIKQLREMLTKSKNAVDPGIEYLNSRGISEETCKRFNVGYIPDAGVLIPYPGTDTPYYVTRKTHIPPNPDGEEKKERYRFPKKEIAGEKPLFNIPALNSTDGGIFIVEGQIDCLSIEDKGFPCVGCNEASQLIAAIEKHGTTAAYFKIIPDDDRTGENKKLHLLQALTDAGIEAHIYELPAGEHDANDFLRHDAAGFWEWCHKSDAVIEGRKLQKYREENGAFFAVDDLVHDLKYPAPIQSGFDELDRQLDGGFYPGLHLLAAITSLGKTTFAMQIADQAAQRGHDVLIFSLEMTKKELIAKSISRLTAKEPNEQDRKTTRAIMRRDQWENYPESGRDAINRAIIAYKKFAQHIYIQDGLGDITAAAIRQKISQHIATTGKKPLVIVDYLQIIAPHNDKAGERQVLDYNVLELKRISRDMDLPVIAITALNRSENASGATNNALKGSSGLEYTADVVLFLQVEGAGKKATSNDGEQARRQNDAAQQEEASKPKRNIELVLTKNRHGGREKKISFTFQAMWNCYEPRGVDPQNGPELQGNNKPIATRPAGF